MFFGRTDRRAYAVNVRSGAEMWQFRANAHIHLLPAVSEQSMYLVADYQQIHCLHFLAGRKKWTSQSKVKAPPPEGRWLLSVDCKSTSRVVTY